jgi:hypothetical protein
MMLPVLFSILVNANATTADKVEGALQRGYQQDSSRYSSSRVAT